MGLCQQQYLIISCSNVRLLKRNFDEEIDFNRNNLMDSIIFRLAR